MTSAETITLTFVTGGTMTCPSRTAISGILPAPCASSGLPYIAALVNNDLASLSYPLEMDCEVKLLTMADPEAWQVYQRSVAFLAAKAVRDLFPAAGFSVDYAVGSGLYCSFEERATRSTISLMIPLMSKSFGV